MTALMVRRGSVCADIGTDHAELCVYLVENGVCPNAFAADLREGPLENAAKTVKRHGLSDKITLRLSDGLCAFLPDEADDIVLAGMGGNLIADILSKAPWIKEKRVIVQPMTHSEDVRRFFAENRLKILREDACFDTFRAYIAFCAEYDENYTAPDDPAWYYRGGFKESDSGAAKAYLDRQKKRITAKLDGLKLMRNDEMQTAFLEKVLECWEE